MKQTAPNPNRLNHLRMLVSRFAFIVLVVASFALMLIGKADTMLVERVRTFMSDAVTPVASLLSQPASTVSAVMDNLRELTAIREENSRLRDENARLLRWQTAARLLEAENDSLKGLLNFVPGPRASFVTARVVADTGGAFAHSLLVTAGSRELVEKGQAAVSGEGLVGRVIEAGHRSSRVLLLTDINSRIPVSVGNARARAILAGDNTERPRLLYLRSQVRVQPGDRVTTSGDAGAFPPGLPVGIVTSVDDGDVRVEPYFQRDKLEYLRIVDYGLMGVLTDIDPGASRPATSGELR